MGSRSGAQVPVRTLLEHGELREGLVPVAEGLDATRALTHARVQKSGLVLVGHVHGLVPTRVQVLGATEMTYLMGLSPEDRTARLEAWFAHGLSLVVVTRGQPVPDELRAVAVATRTMVVATELRTTRTVNLIQGALDRLLAPETRVHGVLVDVHGVGVLLLGPSGIGKSECALFLVERGHRLVADDQVVLQRLPPAQLWGSSPELLRNHLELRGIGIVNVRDLYGAAAVRERKLVQLVVELTAFGEGPDGVVEERLGLVRHTHTLLDVAVPTLKIPVRPGRDMAVILEVAARNHLLQKAGHHAARKFVERLEATLGVADTSGSDDEDR